MEKRGEKRKESLEPFIRANPYTGRPEPVEGEKERKEKEKWIKHLSSGSL